MDYENNSLYIDHEGDGGRMLETEESLNSQQFAPTILCVEGASGIL
jgi:hypothetical protein